MKPPSAVEQPDKPAKPTVVEQLGIIAVVGAVAAATVAATALGGALAPSTPELASNLVARVGDSGEKPLSRVDVQGLGSSGQCLRGALGCSTYRMPKSVNASILALGGGAADFRLRSCSPLPGRQQEESYAKGRLIHCSMPYSSQILSVIWTRKLI